MNKRLRVSVARLDELHPIVSGNKLYKLNYFLQLALKSNSKTILTFGGAYSNHLVATAFACKAAGIKSIGIVRGERPEILSPTLQNCIDYNMQLIFTSRENYRQNSGGLLSAELLKEFENCTIIPEGGYHPLGAKGAGKIIEDIDAATADYICTAAGTATTLAGLIHASSFPQQIIVVPAIKGMTDLQVRLAHLQAFPRENQLAIFNEYHFGGYGKYNAELIHFMNYLYSNFELPTDFVYTAKLMFAIYEKAKANFFKAGAQIICLHTGGLQGNASLPKGSLIF